MYSVPVSLTIAVSSEGTLSHLPLFSDGWNQKHEWLSKVAQLQGFFCCWNITRKRIFGELLQAADLEDLFHCDDEAMLRFVNLAVVLELHSWTNKAGSLTCFYKPYSAGVFPDSFLRELSWVVFHWVFDNVISNSCNAKISVKYYSH